MADLKGFKLSFLCCLISQCAPSLQAESMVFVTDYVGCAIFMADFSSESFDSLTFDALPFSSVFYPMGVDYDPDTRMVYWSESGSIRRANIDGTMQSVIVNSSSVDNAAFIALDTTRGKIFWVDGSLVRIMSANLDGSSQQILINTDIKYPYAIIIHKGEGVMFWTDLHSHKRIERANLDGGDRHIIVDSDIKQTSGLAFNADNSRIFWCDSSTRKIESVDLWGNDRMVHLATSAMFPSDLAVVDDTIIWTDTLANAIGVTSANGSSGYSFYYQNTFQYIRNMHVYREEIPTTTEVYNPTTDQADPEDLPTTTEVYNPTTDQADPAESMVFVTDYSRGAIFMADFSNDSLDSLTFDALPFGSAVEPLGVDYDPDTRMVYWTETSGSIRRANIDGTMQSVIVNSSIVGRSPNIALDTSRGKVFWTDETLDRIMSANLDGSSQQILINTDLNRPYAIIVHKGEGVMFWTDIETPYRIERANLGGGDRYVIVNSGIQWPLGLAFNAEFSRVYWGDLGTDKIESVDLWGNDRMVHLATSSIHPWDLAVVEDSIIWTDPLHDAIGVTSTNGSSGYRFYHGNTFLNPHGLHVYREEMPTTTEVYNPTTDQANPEADLTCDSVSMTIIMDRTVLDISDDARDVHFEDKSCVGYDHDSQHVAITTMYDGCGTTQEQDDDYIIFTNKVTYYKPRPENGTDELITREHYLQIPVTCYLEKRQVLEDSFLPEANLRVFEKKGYGDFSLNLDRYTNSGFYQPANDSGEVTLGTPLYFGVRLTSVTNLTLLIESCWATSSLDPRDDHRYDIIEKGCAVDSTTVIYNWASPTFKGFSIDAFTFIGDNDEVYVHCSILICDNNDSGSRCTQGCIARSRRSPQNTGFQSKLHTITNGPLSDASRSQRAMMLDSVYDV